VVETGRTTISSHSIIGTGITQLALCRLGHLDAVFRIMKLIPQREEELTDGIQPDIPGIAMENFPKDRLEQLLWKFGTNREDPDQDSSYS